MQNICWTLRKNLLLGISCVESPFYFVESETFERRTLKKRKRNGMAPPYQRRDIRSRTWEPKKDIAPPQKSEHTMSKPSNVCTYTVFFANVVLVWVLFWHGKLGQEIHLLLFREKEEEEEEKLLTDRANKKGRNESSSPFPPLFSLGEQPYIFFLVLLLLSLLGRVGEVKAYYFSPSHPPPTPERP